MALFLPSLAMFPTPTYGPIPTPALLCSLPLLLELLCPLSLQPPSPTPVTTQRIVLPLFTTPASAMPVLDHLSKLKTPNTTNQPTNLCDHRCLLGPGWLSWYNLGLPFPRCTLNADRVRYLLSLNRTCRAPPTYARRQVRIFNYLFIDGLVWLHVPVRSRLP